jgi:hypothetical protein
LESRRSCTPTSKTETTTTAVRTRIYKWRSFIKFRLFLHRQHVCTPGDQEEYECEPKVQAESLVASIKDTRSLTSPERVPREELEYFIKQDDRK